jgi:hypothetical protein
MALGITIKPIRPAGGSFKGRKVKAVRFAADDAKPAAGYTVTAANLNLRLIEGVVMGAAQDNNILWAASVNTTASTATSTNQMTLQAYSALGSAATGGIVSASATDMSTCVVTALVYGV